MHRRATPLAVALLLGVVLAGCGSDDTGGTVAEPPETEAGTEVTKIDVKAADFAFNPTEIPLKAGEDVQFVIDNGDQVKHSLTIEGLGVDQDVEGGQSAEAPLTQDVKAGTYNYVCKYHPQMTGTVTVT